MGTTRRTTTTTDLSNYGTPPTPHPPMTLPARCGHCKGTGYVTDTVKLSDRPLTFGSKRVRCPSC